MNARINQRVCTILKESTVDIRGVTDNALVLTKQLQVQLSTLPASLQRDISHLSNIISLDSLENIPTRVKLLLASFQNAVEDPTTLYPTLNCCAEVRLDPAKIYNFSKRHKLLNQIYHNQTNPSAERSIPTTPKSSEDVITNINSSLEHVSDLIMDAVNNVRTLHGGIDDLVASVNGLKSREITAPVDDAFNTEEQTTELLTHLQNLFQKSPDATDAASVSNDEVVDRALVDRATPFELVANASAIIDTLCQLPGTFEDCVARLRNVKAIFSDLIANVKAMFSRAFQVFENLISVLRRFLEQLPQITQEIRHFFVPTGLRALIMRPSHDLLTLLQNIEQLQAGLPDPRVIEETMTRVKDGEVGERKVEIARETVEKILIIPPEFVKAIKDYELKEIILKTMNDTMKEILHEIGGDVVEDVVDGIGNVLGIGGLAEKLDLDNGNDDGGKDGKEGDNNGTGLTSMVGGIAQMGGGLFKKLF